MLETRVQRHAAIDEQRGADHVVGLVGHEPADGARHVVHLADPAIGDQLQQFPPGVAAYGILVDGGRYGTRRPALIRMPSTACSWASVLIISATPPLLAA